MQGMTIETADFDQIARRQHCGGSAENSIRDEAIANLKAESSSSSYIMNV